MQKDGGKLGNLYKDAGFDTFARTGDVYQLFYEKGCRLLTGQGHLCFITSNSWLKAEYGKKTRRHLAEQHTPLRLLEIGKDVFENAIVDTNILIARDGKSNETGKSVDMDRLPDKAFPPDEKLWGQLRLQGERPWLTISATEQSVMDKMETAGTSLKKWDVSIYRGVTSGLNDAFIIDNKTKEALVAEDPKSAAIIKPVLRGRDIQRYQARWAGLWLVYTRKSVEIDRYPAVYRHLRQHQRALSKKAGTNQWYELQASPSDRLDSLFGEEKLFWMDMSDRGRFAYSDTEIYCNDKGFMMTGSSLKYLCAVLNSSLITWLMQNTALTTGVGLTQWKKFAVERLPVPQISATKQRPFIRLVDRILSAKAADPKADTAEQEAEIDRLVYGLYGLTPKEIAAVEGR